MEVTRGWDILICSDCYNKIPQTGWLINNRNSFLTVLKTGSSRSGCQCVQVRASSLLITNFWLYTHTAGWAGELCEVSFIRALIPFMRAPKHLPRPHLLILSHGALGFQHMDFEGTQTFRTQHGLGELFNGYRVSVQDNEIVLEVDVVMVTQHCKCT